MKLLPFDRTNLPAADSRADVVNPAGSRTGEPETTAVVKQSPIYLSRYDYHRLRAIVAAGEDEAVLQELSNELDRAIVVPDHARMPGCVVTMDTDVFLEDQESGEIAKVVVTLPEHADSQRGAVSVIEALGTALLGCSQGDVVTFHSGGARRTSKIVRVVQSSLAEAAASLPVATFS